ncbi:MAG TPA: hypothetical protein VHZ03_57990, partial [Trebonia sp.]|nr:hypothetical protein [Trebonia sp.]
DPYPHPHIDTDTDTDTDLVSDPDTIVVWRLEYELTPLLKPAPKAAVSAFGAGEDGKEPPCWVK